MRGTLVFRAGAWRLRVDAGPDPFSGKRRQLSRTVDAPNTRTGRRRAESELAKFVTEVEARRATPRSGITIAQLVGRYIDARAKTWGPGQADATRARVTNHITPHLGKRTIERLRPVDIADWHTKLRDAGLTEATVGRVHDILRAALSWAVDLELVARNPAARRRPRGTKHEVSPPTPADVIRLLAAADDDLAVFLRIAALTGARRGQLVALQWSDIDLKTGAIRWARALAKVPGGVAMKDTKTGARYATAIDPATADLLRQLRTRAAERALAVGVRLRDDAFVFCRDPAGRQSWHPDGATQRFAALRTGLGLGGVRLHDLRHYMATQLLAEGLDVQTLAGRGGWANATVPLSVYSHFQPARDVEAARRLAERLDGTGG